MTQPLEQSKDADRQKPLILWVVPLVASVLLPGLWWMRADRPFAFRADLIVVMTAFVGGLAVVVVGILSRGFRTRIRWSVGVATMVVIAAFQWTMFAAVGDAFSTAIGLPILADLVPVALAGVLLWLSARLARDWEFAATMSVALLSVLTVLGFANFALIAPSEPDLNIRAAARDAPSVLLMVLDGYGRDDTLLSDFGFDNSPFLDDLEQRGFFIANSATANYSYTYASVSTMLNLDYSFAQGEITEIELDHMRGALSGATGLIPAFKSTGYEIVYLENAWGGSMCGGVVDRCIRDGLFERSLWNLGQMTIFAPLISEFRADPFVSVSLGQLQSLGAVVSSAPAEGKPRFTYAHLLLPHPPLLLDSACNMRSPDRYTMWDAADADSMGKRRANYIAQLQCLNAGVIAVIDAFIGASPDGVVMITGDHGPASALDWGLRLEDRSTGAIIERMTILSAYRLPGCNDDLRSDLTPVNGARALVNCALGTQMPTLPDSNYWMDEIGTGITVDITSRLGR